MRFEIRPKGNHFELTQITRDGRYVIGVFFTIEDCKYEARGAMLAHGNFGIPDIEMRPENPTMKQLLALAKRYRRNGDSDEWKRIMDIIGERLKKIYD